jgi:3-hydroxy-9,10-secoandrosta-1,3,5(10)-triene-9,17-dione monooxygenase reductase component
MHSAVPDARTFRQAVGHFVTGVTVIAFEARGRTCAMTANSFTSLSLDPPLILFCVGKDSRTGRSIREATRFSVNILTESQRHLSSYFAGSQVAEPPPFTFADWFGCPSLDGCAAALACDLREIHEGGDHWIVIGHVRRVEASASAEKPLVFFRGAYTGLTEPVMSAAPETRRAAVLPGLPADAAQAVSRP